MVTRGEIGALMSLDMSAASDTIDRGIMLDVFQIRFSDSDAAIDWFASYFGDRTQQVITGTDLSSVSQLLVGTPQVSVLGPKCFVTYVKDVTETFQQHGIPHHLFADDMQGKGAANQPESTTWLPSLEFVSWLSVTGVPRSVFSSTPRRPKSRGLAQLHISANFHRLINTPKSDLTMYAALDWFASYFGDRTQQVITGTDSSSVSQLLVGTPQGSVLGPKCFVTYAEDVTEIRSSTANAPPYVITDRPVAELLKQFNP